MIGNHYKIIAVIIILKLSTILTAQMIEIQDLNNNNNGYINIKLENVNLIKSHLKILHIINITMYHETTKLLWNNLQPFLDKQTITEPIFNTVLHNYNALISKINNILPHPINRTKRGLINVAGNILKLLTGVMDSDDETEINNKLNALTQTNKNLITENNKQVKINSALIEQTQNITNYIKNQQLQIKTFIDKVTDNLKNRVERIEDQMTYMQH